MSTPSPPAMKHRLQTLLSQNILKSSNCTRCGYVINYPAYTQQKEINVLMDNHIFMKHRMSESERTAAATIFMNQPSRFDAPHGQKRNEEERKKILEENPFTSYVTPIGLHCTPCGKNISLDKRQSYFAYPYEKHCRVSCKHIRAAEIWQKINEVRREEVFFPHSTEYDRHIRAADGYNNAGLVSSVSEQCWAGGKVLKRYNMNPLAIGHRLSSSPAGKKVVVKSERVHKGRSQRGSSSSSASSTSSTNHKPGLHNREPANLATEFAIV